ncbi:MAG: hypothetical protein ACI8S6_004965 [Myxococcota bacterium]|jgi:uncharacterized protein (DUF885 family)
MIVVLSLLSCTPKTTTPPTAVVSAPQHDPEAVAGVTDPALRQLLDDHWGYTMEQFPTWSTSLGYSDYNDRITDGSAAAIAARAAARRAFLDRTRALEGTLSDARDEQNRALLQLDLEQDIAREVCRFGRWSISPRSNALVDWNYLPELHTVENADDGRNLLARYRAIPGAIDQDITSLRTGLAEGRVANRATLEKVLTQLTGALTEPIEDWPLYAPIEAEHAEWTQEERVRYQKGLRDTLVGDIQPAMERYLGFVEEELLPAARGPEAAGLGGLPDGAACYAALVKGYTTLPLTAEALHQTGLDELEKIHAEFREIGGRALGTGELDEIFVRLRTDPELYFDTAEEVEEKAAEALSRAEAVMGEAFGRLPQAECVVRRVPEHEAPFTTIAYYRQPNPDGSKPGEYFVNVSAPETRPRHEAEVLAFHESIPGHHLQIAISQELPELPAFRKHGGQTAFVEGWALYTERLSDELGLYSGDLDRLGMLSFDAWRASRLVVDTGIHHLGWTRQQAEAFMLEATPLAENNIVNEVDRYITTPGQALAYKVGQLTIWRLRQKAESKLGDRFVLSDFHDVVLGAGAVPLPLLESQVDAWIAR